MAAASDLLDMSHPYRVPPCIGAVTVHVTDDPNKVGLAVGAFLHNSPRKVGARIIGGCANMSRLDKERMINFFVEGFAGFSGFVSSGATRNVTESGGIDPMVTDVPAALVSAYGDHVLTLSTVPRVGPMKLVDDSRLIITDAAWGSTICPQPGVHMIVVVQPEYSHDNFDFTGDVEAYLKLFNEFVRSAGWLFNGIVWNGGGVTKYEVTRAAQHGWPLIVVDGTGRAADEIASYLNGGPKPDGVDLSEAARQRIQVVHKDNPGSLNRALRNNRLIAA